MLLKLELAVTCDFGEQFVKATYRLEGDGPLTADCYEIIATLKASIIHTKYYPNVQAIVASTVQDASCAQQCVSYAMSCISPSINYFLERFGDDTKSSKCPLAAFKAARFFSPLFVQDVQPTVNDLDLIKVIPFISDEVLSKLKHEQPMYLTKAATLSSNEDFDILNWWNRHQSDLPQWSGVAETIFLIQPSSVASERVFSILNNSFSDQQQQSLEDYVESSVMLQYNEC